MFDDNNRGPDDSIMWRWGAIGTITCIALYAATVMESDSGFLVNLFGAFLIVVGAGILFVIFSLVGGLIDRFVLGNKGEDTSSNLRFGLFVAALVAVVFAVLHFDLL